MIQLYKDVSQLQIQSNSNKNISCFMESGKLILKLMWKNKNSQKTMEKHWPNQY